MKIDLDLVLQNARKQPVDKVPFSFTLPRFLKDDFEFFCSQNGVTMTSVLVSFIEVFCDDCSERGSGGLENA